MLTPSVAPTKLRTPYAILTSLRCLVFLAFALVLDAARQFVLPLQPRQCVLLRDRGAGVPRDLARLDAAAADLLPPRDVGAPERVRSKAGEVESQIVRASTLRLDGARRVLQCLADAGVSPGEAEIVLPREDPSLGPLRCRQAIHSGCRDVKPPSAGVRLLLAVLGTSMLPRQLRCSVQVTPSGTLIPVKYRSLKCQGRYALAAAERIGV